MILDCFFTFLSYANTCCLFPEAVKFIPVRQSSGLTSFWNEIASTKSSVHCAGAKIDVIFVKKVRQVIARKHFGNY
jgi:hypothetical protein